MNFLEKRDAAWRIEKGLKGLVEATKRRSIIDDVYGLYVAGIAKMAADIKTENGLTGPCYADSLAESANAWTEIWWQNPNKEQ